MAQPSPSKKTIALVVVGLLVIPAVALTLVLTSRPPTPNLPVESEPRPSAEPSEPKSAISAVPEPTPAPPPTHEKSAADSEASKKLEQARQVQVRDPKRARELLREVLALDPQNEPALEDLAKKMLADENGAEARALAKRCTDVNSANMLCGEIVQQATGVPQEHQGMTSMLDMCLKQDPNNVGCMYGKAHLLMLDGKAGDAESLIKRMNQLDPKGRESLLASGRLKASGGDYREALRLLQSACDLQAQPACMRADLLRSEGW
jgi:tetratricopeptide (TPR) repeat protein